MISLDTTRADGLGCYADQSHWGQDLHPDQRPSPLTPVLDSIAASGLRFAWALAQAPTTLSSHASVFTGLDPHGHGVVRNGFPLAEERETLAERLSAAGWATRAVVGASVLEREQGLASGFDRYDDGVQEKVRRRVEDRADRVTERALALSSEAAAPGQGLFLFVHYFDAHSPWDSAPRSMREGRVDPAYQGAIDGSGQSIGLLNPLTRQGQLGRADRRQARALYLTEVTWMDQHIGELLQGLERQGWMKDSLIVVFGDHGETLEEIPGRAYGHGLDVDLVDIHVPLLLRGAGRYALPAGQVVQPLVRLQDIGPTLLGRLGLPTALGEGVDLAPTWSGQDLGLIAYAEATKPAQAERSDAWNNLRMDRSVARGDLLLNQLPFLSEGPTLHRLAPGAPIVDDPLSQAELEALLQRWDAAAPPARPEHMSDRTREGLEALGYIEPGDAAGPK
jgi:arylsulfatase A-like enzyme